MSLNLTALILAKNEEKNIEACIKSVLFAGEVIVIDDFSTDKTAEIARSLGAKVVQRAMEGNWGSSRPLPSGRLRMTGSISSMQTSA